MHTLRHKTGIVVIEPVFTIIKYGILRIINVVHCDDEGVAFKQDNKRKFVSCEVFFRNYYSHAIPQEYAQLIRSHQAGELITPIDRNLRKSVGIDV